MLVKKKNKNLVRYDSKSTLIDVFKMGIVSFIYFLKVQKNKWKGGMGFTDITTIHGLNDLIGNNLELAISFPKQLNHNFWKVIFLLNYMHNLRKLIVWGSYTLGHHNNMDGPQQLKYHDFKNVVWRTTNLKIILKLQVNNIFFDMGIHWFNPPFHTLLQNVGAIH